MNKSSTPYYPMTEIERQKPFIKSSLKTVKEQTMLSFKYARFALLFIVIAIVLLVIQQYLLSAIGGVLGIVFALKFIKKSKNPKTNQHIYDGVIKKYQEDFTPNHNYTGIMINGCKYEANQQTFSPSVNEFELAFDKASELIVVKEDAGTNADGKYELVFANETIPVERNNIYYYSRNKELYQLSLGERTTHLEDMAFATFQKAVTFLNEAESLTTESLKRYPLLEASKVVAKH